MRRRRRRLVSRSLHYNDRESLALFAYETHSLTHSLCDSAECGGAFAGARGLGNLCPKQIMNMLHATNGAHKEDVSTHNGYTLIMMIISTVAVQKAAELELCWW